jgi:hypothetical protein
MDTFGYRFLRLNSETLALVEVYLPSYLPEPCQEIYPYEPYLQAERLSCIKQILPTITFQRVEDWKEECEFGFNVAVRTAKFYPIMDYTTRLKTEEREAILWKILDPLVYWDEFVPLFDNEFNLILR